jgi:tetratricopeptide (TPR) repeat protein
VVDSVEEEIRELRTLFWSERDPEGRAFAPLADAYRRQGDLGQALELLEDGLGRHSSFAPGHIVAAWVRRDRGEAEEADREFGLALALDEENAEALRGLGELAAGRGDHESAAAHYQKLIELEPGDLEIVARLREIEQAARSPVPAAPVLEIPSYQTPSFEPPAAEPPALETPSFETPSFEAPL